MQLRRPTVESGAGEAFTQRLERCQVRGKLQRKSPAGLSSFCISSSSRTINSQSLEDTQVGHTCASKKLIDFNHMWHVHSNDIGNSCLTKIFCHTTYFQVPLLQFVLDQSCACGFKTKHLESKISTTFWRNATTENSGGNLIFWKRVVSMFSERLSPVTHCQSTLCSNPSVKFQCLTVQRQAKV